MRELKVKQGDQEWLDARLGLATASRFRDILAKIKTGEAAARRDYRMELLCERLTRTSAARKFCSPEMQWGIEHEQQARAAYEWFTGRAVRAAGFCRHDELMAGASPDGWVYEEGIIEIKCPKTATHIETLLSATIPPEHIPQIQGQLWITGRKWCDFVSFDPRLPDGLNFFTKRCHYDSDYARDLATEVQSFLEELDSLTDRCGEQVTSRRCI